MHLLDLSDRITTPELRELLTVLVAWRSDAAEKQRQVDRVLAAYQHDPELRLWGMDDASGLAGLIGLQLVSPHDAVIQHIVVHSHARARGLGRALIAEACRRCELQRLTAETDRDAVQFYRQCGFVVTSLGEKYPGVERFSCVWNR
ncbi:MAG: GNAT family N-acetyltransferase [Polyangiales bacterium]